MENIKEKKREITEIDHLFVDEKDARFWKTEGVRHNNLFWVRAMISRKRSLRLLRMKILSFQWI